MGLIYLAGAVLSVCMAHFIRIARWQLFISIYEKPGKRILIRSLCLGYLLNNLLPYKIGDFFRAWAAGRKMKNGKALGFSTVIVDRYLDVVFVGMIFIFLSLGSRGGSQVVRQSAVFYITASAVLAALPVLACLCRGSLKKVARLAAGMFNERIEAFLLRFFWALIWNFKDIFFKIRRWELLLHTLGMWVFYILSYFLYGAFLGTQGNDVSWMDMFTMLFAQNGISLSTFHSFWQYSTGMTAHLFFWILYMTVPLALMLAASVFVREEKETEDAQEYGYINLLPHLDPRERLAFLENYFSDSNREYVAAYLQLNQQVSIIRDYSAGSNATTMLCMDGNGTFFRKYAFGDDGEKLNQQILWIQEYRDVLRLPDILRQDKNELYCYYDMPYSSNTTGLFAYVHSMPLEKSWRMIRLVLESLEASIYRMHARACDRNTVHEYVTSKVLRNLKKIRAAKRVKNLLQYEAVTINGVRYRNLQYYEKYLTEEYLWEVFQNDTYAVIHGDLTIENIICSRGEDGRDGFYIIDPNTGNIHDSPNLDYAKLLQSIHGGYEFLMSAKGVKVTGSRIDFLFTRSSAYMELHKKLRAYMQETFGSRRTKSIYFHEMIHWLRLMPYKIEKDEKRALLFYAGMLMVMNDVMDMYGETGGSRIYDRE